MKRLLLSVVVLAIIAGIAAADPEFIAVANNVQGEGYVTSAADGSQVPLENGIKLYNGDQLQLAVGASVHLVSVGAGANPVTVVGTEDLNSWFNAESGVLVPGVPGPADLAGKKLFVGRMDLR